jgi:hypothetical protein
MKQKYTSLKMYLVGMTVGLFIWGWSAVAHQDAAQANTASQVAISQTTSSTTVQTSSTNQQTVSRQPRIRTRTS